MEQRLQSIQCSAAPLLCGTLLFDSDSTSSAILPLISLALIFKLNLIINYWQTSLYTPLFGRGHSHSKVLPFSCIQHIVNEIVTHFRVENALFASLSLQPMNHFRAAEPIWQQCDKLHLLTGLQQSIFHSCSRYVTQMKPWDPLHTHTHPLRQAHAYAHTCYTSSKYCCEWIWQELWVVPTLIWRGREDKPLSWLHCGNTNGAFHFMCRCLTQSGETAV